MNFAAPTDQSEGHSTTWPLFFYGSYFILLKAQIKMFLQREDYRLWDRIINGPKIPMKLVNGKSVQKTKSEFNAEDLIPLKKYAKAKNILVYGLGPS